MPSVSEVVALFDLGAVILLLSTLVVFAVPIFILFPPIPVERGDALRQTHSKLGISASESNLRNQTSPHHNYKPGKAATIQSLYIYPVKSCRGIEIKHGKVSPKGLELDRLFAFAREKPGRTEAPASPGEENSGQPRQLKKNPQWELLTLRQVPLLANVRVDLWLPDASKTSRQLGKVHGRFMVIGFPWKDSGLKGVFQWISAKLSRGLSGFPEREFMLPIDFPSASEIQARGYRYEDAQFFTKSIRALNMENEVPRELGLYLGVAAPMTIFMIDPAQRRQVLGHAPRKDDAGYQPVIDFQDTYPLHLLSLASIRALESKVQKDDGLKFLDARRFRPNIIVSGLKEYDEDGWRCIEFSQPPRGAVAKGPESKFDVSCRTVRVFADGNITCHVQSRAEMIPYRCKLPNVDPATGIRHKVEPDNSLRKYRNIDGEAPKSGCFGVQLCPMFSKTIDPEDMQFLLEVGMEIEVLQRGQHLAL
ncbi:mosc domain-containing [Trichoderma cornu-damae]|uniref:Mosc domain-containing n=1 Tax=Trichoderma cornu-damae TaxID=654480 RepID=A0A9P8TWH8_9HYPO|nr:mosc domain-containing [Trichoderma cornu-damae]